MSGAWRTRLRSFVIITVLLFLGGASSAIAQSNYRFVPIGAGQTPAYDINDEGVAVGFFVFGDANGNRGYRWTESTGPVGVVPSPGDVNKFPYFSAQSLAINNGGTIVGQGSAAGAVPFVPTILSPSGVFTFLPPSETPSVSATARGVSNAGAVVGVWRANDQAAFYWTEATGIEAISPAPSDQFFARDAFDVNDAGFVVGWCTGSECGTSSSGYLWSRTGGHTVVPKVAGFSNASHEALAINERNQVVGRYTGGGGVAGVFFWSAATGTLDLGAPAGQPQNVDINDRGQIVATITPPAGGGTVPYLFNNGAWTNLNTLMPPGTTFRLDTVRAINNHGWMAGSANDPLTVGYVLIPPTVDMTANGGDGPLTLGPASPLQISLAFDGGNAGLLNPAELYTGFVSPFGVFWITPGGLSATPTRLYAGPLPSFGPVPLINLPAAGVLPAGTYIWFTIVDNDTDGTVDAHFFDFVVTTRTP